MGKLVTLLEQHLDRQPPTVVTQATTWWETILSHVKLMECGLGGNLPVKVCFCCCLVGQSVDAHVPKDHASVLYKGGRVIDLP